MLGSGAGQSLTGGSNNLDIANSGVAGESGKIRIGTSGTQTAAFLAGVSGTSIPGPTEPVLVNSAGQLGTASLSPRKGSSSEAAGGAHLRAVVRRQQRDLGRLSREVRRLR